MTIEIIHGDITQLEVDAIVNAANQRLLGGGGVDGAIHRAAGRDLVQACRALPEVRPGVRCPTGEVRITPAFQLPANWVIHTVGPVYPDDPAAAPALLASCYRKALQLAQLYALSSLAFPAISCGVFGYPPQLAVEVVAGCLQSELQAGQSLQRVILVAHDPAMHTLLRQHFVR